MKIYIILVRIVLVNKLEEKHLTKTKNVLTTPIRKNVRIPRTINMFWYIDYYSLI